MYYVYLIECQDDKSWYIGYSADLSRRIKDHQSGNGCCTTGMKKNWKLVYYEAYIDKRDAIGREKFLKSGSGRKYLKRNLIFKLSKILSEWPVEMPDNYLSWVNEKEVNEENELEKIRLSIQRGRSYGDDK
jgi:putative endonuclease